jgi:hypothetical protein
MDVHTERIKNGLALRGGGSDEITEERKGRRGKTPAHMACQENPKALWFRHSFVVAHHL